MADVDKVRFLDAPVSQVGLFGDTVEDFAQQFSAVQMQMETNKHILPRRDKASGARPPPACRPPAATTPAPPLARSQGATPQQGRRASRRKRAQPVSLVDPDDTDAFVLRGEIVILLVKDAIEPVPPAEMKTGFYSPYFIVLKKSGGPFLRFAFKGRAYQYNVLPFGLSLSPREFGKHLGDLALLWGQGILILNYLDDWLIIAHSRDLLCQHRYLVLQHLSHLGLQVNWEKSNLSPVQSIFFLGMELDSVNMTACLTNERVQSMLNCLKLFSHKTAVPLKHFRRLLGHMAAAAAVTPLGLLHMRPLQRWLHDRILRWAWHRGTSQVGVTPECCLLFSPWSDPAFLRAGVPLGQLFLFSEHWVLHAPQIFIINQRNYSVMDYGK
ncbi:ORF V: Enzymatic polyprotein [Labeo rohita]|uniref:ribonuclease H n=1 Tax=Labeo rohita TaxID=84645 RepID=A0ABQ8L8P8_LABRO|nr:ORF V: Enzymatic polyprotein [Labeo rohita]